MTPAISTLLPLALLLVMLQGAFCGRFHPGRLHGPPICSMRFTNMSLACFENCPEHMSCRAGYPGHLATALRRLGVDIRTVSVCWEMPCTATSCAIGYSCENHFWRRRCYRSPCERDSQCPTGTQCRGWPNENKRCFPQPCGAFDSCPFNFSCLDRGLWRACYPDQCRSATDCPVTGSICINGGGGRRCVAPTGQCDTFMDRNHEEWHNPAE